MQELEKVLQEIEERAVCSGNEENGFVLMKHVRNIIRKHLSDSDNDDWIPVEEWMPEEHDSMFAKRKGTERWCSGMFEKESNDVNVTVEYENGTRQTITMRTLDGKWNYPKRIIKQKAIAWRPLPEPYRPAKRGIAGCW